MTWLGIMSQTGQVMSQDTYEVGSKQLRGRVKTLTRSGQDTYRVITLTMSDHSCAWSGAPDRSGRLRSSCRRTSTWRHLFRQRFSSATASRPAERWAHPPWHITTHLTRKTHPTSFQLTQLSIIRPAQQVSQLSIKRSDRPVYSRHSCQSYDPPNQFIIGTAVNHKTHPTILY